MLTLLCQECKNWFVRSDEDKHIGKFEIEGGVLVPSLDLQDGQFYRIIGSVFNDGVHKYGDTDDVLTDEEFEGAVWCLAIPKQFVDLAKEITDYNVENGKASAFTSESFGGYSYTRKTNNLWQETFKTKINMYRKLV